MSMIEYLPLTPELARRLASAAEPGLSLPFGAELWAQAAAKAPELNFAGRATLSTPIEFSREVPDEKSLVGRVSVISRRVDRGSCFSAVGRDGVAAARLVG